MNMGTLRGLITLVLMLAFCALAIWLFSKRNKHRFDDVAQLPLEDDAQSIAPARAHKGARAEGAANQSKEHAR